MSPRAFAGPIRKRETGFKMLNPSLDGGIDLSREYAHARKLAGLA